MSKYTPAIEHAKVAIEIGPIVWYGRYKCGRSQYAGAGGRMFSSATINALVKGGYATVVGRGVVSCRMMREAANRQSGEARKEAGISPRHRTDCKHLVTTEPLE